MRIGGTRTTLALAAAIAVAPGCGTEYLPDSAPEPSASALTREGHEVFESFEYDPPWVIDSADDPAELTCSAERATHGASSLRVRFTPGKRRKVSIRREVKIDLSTARSVTLDVWTASEGVALALAVVTAPGGRYFESRQAAIPKLKTGPSWQTVRFRLDGPYFKSAESEWINTAPITNADDTRRLILVVYTGTTGEGEAFIDRLAFDRPAAELGLRLAPRAVSVLPRSHRVRVWGRFDLRLAFEASYASPFDPREIVAYADVRSPGGTISRAPAFIGKDGQWRIRYVPLEPGRHTYEVAVANTVGRRTLPPDSFDASSGSGRGPVGTSRRDPRHFEYASGEPFYPVGTNVAWASDFRPYFRKFADAGVNVVRIWLAPWSLPVASRTKAGEIDLDAADRLEGVLDLARENGLKVQLVLAYHGEFVEGWPQSPYSAVNGGPCAVPAEFFTHREARAAFRSLLRYVAARYASHPALFAWELFNEVDLVPTFSAKVVASWHRHMARYLRANDPVGHPITTSVAGFGRLPELDTVAGIDFLQAHFYRSDADGAVLDHWGRHAGSHKPTVIGEFGAATTAGQDQEDARGARLGASLWLSLASPASGTAMPWWWDTQIDPQDLYGLWRPVAALARKIDRRGKHWRFVQEAYVPGKTGARDAGEKPDAPTWARVHGILTRSEGLLYFYDPRVLEDPSGTPSVLPGGGAVTVKGLVDGPYRIELWGGAEARPSLERSASAKGGRLRVELPPSKRDFAVYFRSADAGEPGIAR